MFANYRKLLLNNIARNKNSIQKLYATQVTAAAASEAENIVNDEWNQALPYAKIPGPSRIRMIYDSSLGPKKGCQVDELMNYYRSVYGDIFKIPGMFGQSDMISIFDPSDFERVFRNEGQWPIRRGIEILEYHRWERRTDIFKSGGLGIDQGQKWADFRSTVNPVMMQPKIIKYYVGKIDEIAVEFVDRMKNIRDPKSLEMPTSFEGDLNAWSLESITIIALDAKLGLIGNLKTESKAKEFISAVKRQFKILSKLFIQPPFWRIYPTKDFKEMMKTLDTIADISKSFVDAARLGLESKGSERNETRDENEDSILKKLIKIDPIIATTMAIDMIGGGVDTTSSGLITTLYNLAKYPDKQETLRNEIMTILPTKETKLTPDKMKNLPYLRACIKEGMRVIPVVNGNLRDVAKDLVIQNYQIPKGSRVVMNFYATMRSETNFTDANQFIPERWLRTSDSRACPAAKREHPFSYLPFGFGPRMCIGRRFAELEMEVLLSRIIRNFRVEWHKPDLKFRTAVVNVPDCPLHFKIIDLEY